jgi:hypothetical protein
VHLPEIIDNADVGKMVGDTEKLRSSLDSVLQKSIKSDKSFKNVFNNCNNAGLCYLYFYSRTVHYQTWRDLPTNALYYMFLYLHSRSYMFPQNNAILREQLGSFLSYFNVNMVGGKLWNVWYTPNWQRVMQRNVRYTTKCMVCTW